MMDVHIHLERGPYNLDWANKFIDSAQQMGLDEIYLLEHSHRFIEFMPLYKEMSEYSENKREWINKKCNLALSEYTDFISQIRETKFPIKVKFGLEVCYSHYDERLIEDLTKSYEFDFVTGSVHWVDGFCFDHHAEDWVGIDVDRAYKRYFELTENLIKSGLFTGLAHPDLLKIFGHLPSYDLSDTYDSIAKLLNKYKMYAEQSGGAHLRFPERELGMNKDFVKALKRNNVDIRTASDAHRPSDVGVNIKELQDILLG